jgi:kumamolisin
MVLMGGLLAACGGGTHKANANLLDSISPKPGALAPIPKVAPDPPNLDSMIGLPEGSADQITFYFSLPTNDATLVQAAKVMTTPGTGSYRHYFTSYTDAARTYGAKASDIEAAVASVKAKGLSVLVDPSRTFARVWATAAQWEKVLGRPLAVVKATSSSPFDIYNFPSVPKFAKLTYVGAGATVYDAALDNGNVRATGASTANEAAINRRAGIKNSSSTSNPVAWPFNTGTPPSNTCVSGTVQASAMYSPSQIATAYDTHALQETPATDAVRVTVVDLGGGFSENDIEGAAKCFGYTPPSVEIHTGDGITDTIINNNDETELDLQTMAAFVPGATIQLIEDTNGPASLLDALARMGGDPQGFSDGASISYGQCAIQESNGNLALIHAIARVVLVDLIVGGAIYVSAGDWGSTTCGIGVKGTSQSFAASAPWAVAVGGTRLSLNSANQRASEVVWNDTTYGLDDSTGGGVSKVFSRPWYQNGISSNPMRAVPDIAFLADASPGWPVMLDGQMQSIGGTSGSSPFALAQLALLSAQQHLAGKPLVGFPNPWFYQLYQQHPELFYDVTSGSNDLDAVGCCQATKGFDQVTGLGVPDLTKVAQHLPPPSP